MWKIASTPVPAIEEVPERDRRSRAGKKRRIAIRKKHAARIAEAEAEKKKRTRRNREKKVKKKERGKREKVEAEVEAGVQLR